MMVATHAACSLMRRFTHDCKRLRANESELNKVSDAYFRYRELLHEQQQIRNQVLKTFGVLGVHSPDVTDELARLISPTPITSLDIQKTLRLWEVLELFLSSVDNRATVSDFKDFLCLLAWNFQVTTQAIDSAVKAHPDLFREEFEGREKFLVLKLPSSC